MLESQLHTSSLYSSVFSSVFDPPKQRATYILYIGACKVITIPITVPLGFGIRIFSVSFDITEKVNASSIEIVKLTHASLESGPSFKECSTFPVATTKRYIHMYMYDE